jgi:hypothetical protein
MMNIDYEQFMFMPGHTIEAIIRSKNKYVRGEILRTLVHLFNQKNGLRVPKPGEVYQIPVFKNEN